MNIKMIKYLSNELLKVYLKYKMLVRVIWQLAKCILQDLNNEVCRYRVFHEKFVVKSLVKLSCIKFGY
jgi:hypothetical protein